MPATSEQQTRREIDRQRFANWRVRQEILVRHDLTATWRKFEQQFLADPP